ncbi:MAG: paraquat-inducible protein A [Arenicellales bacterium]|nr:paraquat-inducible protein A [Arenicellales bacterium]
MNLLLVTLVVVFAIGIWAPILTLKRLLVIQNTFSILSGIVQLARDGQYGLFSLLTVFTLVLPCFKIAVLFAAWNSKPKQSRILGWLSALGKWSMLDVFVVAVLIASVKLGALATIEVHYGLYVFAAAVILMIFNTNFVYKRLSSAAS